jgi:hypothetical protein
MNSRRFEGGEMANPFDVVFEVLQWFAESCGECFSTEEATDQVLYELKMKFDLVPKELGGRDE